MNWRAGVDALIVVGVLCAIGIAVGSFLSPNDSLEEPVSGIVFVGVILLLLGLPALYTVLARARLACSG